VLCQHAAVAVSVKTGRRTVSEMVVTLVSVEARRSLTVRACSSNVRYSLMQICQFNRMLAVNLPAPPLNSQCLPCLQAAGEGAPWACSLLFEGASCRMSDDWQLQQRRLQRTRQREALERARDAAMAAAAQAGIHQAHASIALA